RVVGVQQLRAGGGGVLAQEGHAVALLAQEPGLAGVVQRHRPAVRVVADGAAGALVRDARGPAAGEAVGGPAGQHGGPGDYSGGVLDVLAARDVDVVGGVDDDTGGEVVGGRVGLVEVEAAGREKAAQDQVGVVVELAPGRHDAALRVDG